MSLEAQLCWTLICLLFTVGPTVGDSAQSTPWPPAQCVQNFRIDQDRIDLNIMPGVVNCFSCALDTTGSRISWQVEVDGDPAPVPVSSLPDIVVDGNFLVIAMPDNYVQPGTSGRRDIHCSTNSQSLEARLASPILRQPLFANVTVSEGELLELTCITRNIPDITTLQILDSNGMPLDPLVISVGVITIPNVTRNYAGVYTCVVTSTIDNSTVNATSVVIVEYDHPTTTTVTVTDTDIGEGSDDHPTTTTVTVIDTDMGEGSGTSNIRLSTTVTGTIETGPGEDSDNGSTVQIVSATTVISVFVLVGVLFILGLLVYTIKRKKNRSPPFEGCEMKNATVNIYEKEQGASDQNLILNEVVEHQNSRATDSTTLIYADIGPNAVNRVQKVVVPDDNKYKVQYAAINYNAKAPQNLCVPIASMTKVVEDELKSVDLDSLLIVLKEGLAPKWYEFGLVVGVPQELMDSYSGYPSDQCLTEVLDYWLRHHAGTMKWAEVADALKAVELNQLAEKVQLLSSSAQKSVNDRNVDDYCADTKLEATEENTCTTNLSAPKLPPKPQPQVE